MAFSAFMPGYIPPLPAGSTSWLQGHQVSSVSLSKVEPQNAQLLSPKGGSQQMKDVSQDFEALLLSFMFKAMRQTVPTSDFLGKGRDRAWYEGLLDLELARSFAHGGGIGLSALIQGDLQRLQTGRGDVATAMDAHRRGMPTAETRRTTPTHGDHDRGAAPSSDGSPAADARAPAPANPGDMGLPVAGKFSSPYGLRLDPFGQGLKFHHGLDIASPAGTEIRAVRPGTVLFSGWKAGYGLTVILSHEDGYRTQYSHNSRNLVQVGERVHQEQPIARVGQTGQTTGPHLHFEVQREGRSVDPTPLFVTKS